MTSINVSIEHQGDFFPDDAVSNSIFSVCGRTATFFMSQIKSLITQFPGSAIYIQVILWPLKAINDISPKMDGTKSVKSDVSVKPEVPGGDREVNFCTGNFYIDMKNAARKIGRRCLMGHRDTGLNCNLQIKLPNKHGFATGFVFNRKHRRGLYQ